MGLASNVSFTKLAQRGGSLTFNFPGDVYSYIQRTGGKDSGLQGYRGWKYGYSIGHNMPVWFDTNNYDRYHFFKDSSWGSIPFFNTGGEMHPARHGDQNYLNVIRWKAPRTGQVRMIGCMYDSNLGGGNGVNFWVGKMNIPDGLVRGSNIREFVLPAQHSNNSTALFNKSISVNAGDVFYMVVGPDSEHSYDTTVGKWTIYYESCPDMSNMNLSLREMVEDQGRYNCFMPNYYPNGGTKHGQLDWNRSNFSDRNTLHSVRASHMIHSTIVPDLIRTGSTHDTNIYGRAGNGTLQVSLVHGPGGAQWWGNAVNPDTTMFLFNVNPPAAVAPAIKANNYLETAAQTGNQWYSGTSANPNHGGSNGQAAWTNLVGGLYGVETGIKYTINGQLIHWHLGTGHTFPAGSRQYVNRGLNAYAWGGWANL